MLRGSCGEIDGMSRNGTAVFQFRDTEAVFPPEMAVGRRVRFMGRLIHIMGSRVHSVGRRVLSINRRVGLVGRRIHIMGRRVESRFEAPHGVAGAPHGVAAAAHREHGAPDEADESPVGAGVRPHEAGVAPCSDGSADFQSAVSPNCIRQGVRKQQRSWRAWRLRIANPRYKQSATLRYESADDRHFHSHPIKRRALTVLNCSPAVPSRRRRAARTGGGWCLR